MQTAEDIRLRIQSGNVKGLLELLQARSTDTSGAALLLTGVAGIGKSTSLDAVLQGLSRRTARAFRVSADEPSRRQPFGLVSSRRSGYVIWLIAARSQSFDSRKSRLLQSL